MPGEGVGDTAKLPMEKALAKINPPAGKKSDFDDARELLKLVLEQRSTDSAEPPDPLFLLDLRALEQTRGGHRDEAVADRVLVHCTREGVLRYATP